MAAGRLTQYRLELEKARDDDLQGFQRGERGQRHRHPVWRRAADRHSRAQRTVCRSNAENRAYARGGPRFSEFAVRQRARVVCTPDAGSACRLASQCQCERRHGRRAARRESRRGRRARSNAKRNAADSSADNRDLYRAVTPYVEVEQEYARARGDTSGPAEEASRSCSRQRPRRRADRSAKPARLTEFQQRNNVARVSGTVSISSCPAGTTGTFTLVARVRDDAGEIKPIEFNETWQRADAADHSFNTDYPIGENVELMSVRVRGLTCTCADPAHSNDIALGHRACWCSMPPGTRLRLRKPPNSDGFRMRTFACDVCGNTLYFENDTCLECTSKVGFRADEMTMVAVHSAEATGLQVCRNWSDWNACNWFTAGAIDPSRGTASRAGSTK